jgi:hypothetical protein
MQALITQIANRHNFDLTGDKGELALSAGSGFLPLAISKRGKSVVVVAHYRPGRMCDPEMEFTVTPEGWTPKSLKTCIGKRRYATDSTGTRQELLDFAEGWATDSINLNSQLKHGKVIETVAA